MRPYEWVFNYLQEAGLKQSAVAKSANISVPAFNAMLHGKRKMYADDLKALCEVLGVSADEILFSERYSEKTQRNSA